MEGRVTLDKADNNVNADKAKLNITFSCDLCSNECQTLEELEAHKNSHLVGYPNKLANLVRIS